MDARYIRGGECHILGNKGQRFVNQLLGDLQRFSICYFHSTTTEIRNAMQSTQNVI